MVPGTVNCHCVVPWCMVRLQHNRTILMRPPASPMKGLMTEINLEVTNIEIAAAISSEGFILDWQYAREPLDNSLSVFQKQLFSDWRKEPYQALYNLAFQKIPANSLRKNPASLPDSIQFLKNLSEAFLTSIKQQPDIEFLRENAPAELAESEIQAILDTAPFMTGIQHLDNSWVKAIGNKLLQVFRAEIRDYRGSVAEYLASKNSHANLMGRIFFHLVENKNGSLPFAFMATYSSRTSSSGETKHLPLKNALIEFQGNNQKLLELLSTVSKAAAGSAFIQGLHDSGDIFHPIGLTAEEAFLFLKEIPQYEEAGIRCRIPNWWKSQTSSPRLSLTIGEKPPSHVGTDSLLSFDLQLSLGEESLSVEELHLLLAETEGLALIKGKWIEINHKRLEEILKAYEEAKNQLGRQEITLLDAMKMQFSLSSAGGLSKLGSTLEITNGQWLNSVLLGLIGNENAGAAAPPPIRDRVTPGDDFHAILRPYQERGLAWLHTMKTLGLGACLADDMGLGKTIQVIALLNSARMKRKEKNLLVIPASLIGNWVSEIKRFAPLLKYSVLHPSETESNDAELYITTYGMLSRYRDLLETKWDTVILDEAQAIKNPTTKQTKAVKQLKADFRITMTGTPVENRLSDLWSIFDFINCGLLGTAKEFTDFTRGLKDNRAGYARLRKVVEPFILRRLKTDKNIIGDLPDKIEMKTYSYLSKKQATLYDALVRDIRYKLEATAEGIERKGLILSSIMKFKQICNHPDQYLGRGAYSHEESGKYERLREICEIIYEKRERVLVFTQFQEMTGPLKDFLETVFLHEGLVIHGGTPVAKRKQIVERFQGEEEYVPFLVLSIKAGGVGLNLTKASHVIHFDRWWNPAVENQATDRAFRIGQTKNVIVHKFITKGTIEEKIDKMIADKEQLAKDIIPESQEKWITEMDNSQLMELFRLGR